MLWELLDYAADDQVVVDSQCEVMSTGPVPAILAAQTPHGYWVKPGSGYNPKYRSIVFYVTDMLQNLEALTSLGYSGDSRLTNAIAFVLSKQDRLGRWKMEYSYNGKTWVDIEQKGKPSKWVTLRALRVLKKCG